MAISNSPFTGEKTEINIIQKFLKKNDEIHNNIISMNPFLFIVIKIIIIYTKKINTHK